MFKSPGSKTNQSSLNELDRYLVWIGFKEMVPISLFVMIYGVAFGLASVQVGLQEEWSVIMSALVFAGAAQFAALDIWGNQVPIITMALTVFAINARHLLMGATLYPWLRSMPKGTRYGVMIFASDSNWALTMRALTEQKNGFGLLFGGGLALWLFWILGTGVGCYFGGVISNPKQFGLDMVMACFLLSMVIGGYKNSRTIFIWAVAATTSLLAHRLLHNNTHVVIGAISGGLLGAFWTEKDHEH